MHLYFAKSISPASHSIPNPTRDPLSARGFLRIVEPIVQFRGISALMLIGKLRRLQPLLLQSFLCSLLHFRPFGVYLCSRFSSVPRLQRLFPLSAQTKLSSPRQVRHRVRRRLHRSLSICISMVCIFSRYVNGFFRAAAVVVLYQRICIIETTDERV